MADEIGPQPNPPAAQQSKPQNFPAVDDAHGIQLRPRNFEELWKFAGMVAATDFVPQSFRNNPGAVVAACQLGQEVGLPPMTALKWIAVINGTPSIWGDGYWMLLRSHPLCESATELSSEEALKAGYGECTIKRKGSPPVTRRFTKEMAEKAGLWGGKGSDQSKKEQSPWFKYPGRMLQFRARGLAGRDAIPEATGPLSMREEAQDFAEPTDVTPAAEQPKPQETMKPQPLQEATNAGIDLGGNLSGFADGPGGSAVDAEGLGSDEVRSETSDSQPQVGEDKGGAGATGTEGSASASDDPGKWDLEERRAWASKATLEELSSQNNQAIKDMKILNQKDRAEICRYVTDRRQILLVESKKEREQTK